LIYVINSGALTNYLTILPGMESFGFCIWYKNNFMKQLRLFIFPIAVISFLFSCNSHQSSLQEDKMGIAASKVDSVVSDMDSAVINEFTPPNLSERNFVRTASLKFKANDIAAAIIESENKVRALGGYVSLSTMKNSVQDSNSIPITADSLMRTVRYLTSADLVLRLPDNQLDSLLASLSKVSTMMYHREIRCDDISIQLLENKLKTQRAETTGWRLNSDINQRGKKLVDIGEMEKSIEEKDAARDDAKIASLTLKDAVKYSTVSVEISQESFIQYTEIARERIIPEYKLPYSAQLGESFSAGWQFLKDLTIYIARFWSVLLLMGLVFIIYRRWKGNFLALAKSISKA
jgi:hypothetical protein